MCVGGWVDPVEPRPQNDPPVRIDVGWLPHPIHLFMPQERDKGGTCTLALRGGPAGGFRHVSWSPEAAATYVPSPVLPRLASCLLTGPTCSVVLFMAVGRQQPHRRPWREQQRAL